MAVAGIITMLNVFMNGHPPFSFFVPFVNPIRNPGKKLSRWGLFPPSGARRLPPRNHHSLRKRLFLKSLRPPFFKGRRAFSLVKGNDRGLPASLTRDFCRRLFS